MEAAESNKDMVKHFLLLILFQQNIKLLSQEHLFLIHWMKQMLCEESVDIEEKLNQSKKHEIKQSRL